MRRAFRRLSAVSTSAVGSPGDRLAGEQQGLRKIRLHQIDVVRGDQDGAPLAVPALHQSHQVGGGLGVDGGERLVEHDHARVLQQQAGKQHALHLPAGERADGALLESGEADRGDGRFDRLMILAADAAEQRPCVRHSPIATMS